MKETIELSSKGANKLKSGQSIIEIIIALGIGTILIVGALTALTPILKSEKYNGQAEVAIGLGKEMLDNARVFVEGDWHNILSLATTSANKYYLNTTSSPFTIATGTQSIVVATSTYTRYFYVDDVKRDGGGSISLSGTINDPSTKKVTVVYTWPGNASKTISTYITRSTNNIVWQTDWSGGSGQNGPSSSTNSQFATSSNVDYSTTTGSVRIQGI